MEIKLTEFQEPKVVINYEEVKAHLKKQLENYTGLVVTEETLPACKAAQKELASARVDIDGKRKEKKKELEQPIKAFETQCKELIALIEEVEKPIKEGIKAFDDMRREEKRQQAVQFIDEVAEAAGLNEKYKAELDVIDKYMNLTATAKAVKEDLETRAFALKVEQDREQERLDIIQSVIDAENARINTKLCMKDFEYFVNIDRPTADIIAEIKKRAQQIYDAENKAVEPPKTEEVTHTPPIEEKAENEPQAQPEKQYVATLKMFGTVTELRSVSAFLKEHNITYEVIDQREM